MAISVHPTSVLFSRSRRSFTLGLILVVTLVAFEAMGVAAALPTVVRDLHGQRWYSWAFTVFMASSAVATVLSGQVCDRRGPAPALLGGMGLFFAGLVVSGTAVAMPILLVGRMLQGLGGGLLTVALYVMIAGVYPAEHRPKAFGALSAAWVVPALVGPTVSGLLTERVSWRLVFLGLAPLVLVGAVLLIPTVRRLRHAVPDPTAGDRRGLVRPALTTALGLIALMWAGQELSPLGSLVGLGGLAAVASSLRRLLPAGTLLARPGIPVMVLARGLLAGVFFGAQAFVPLTLSVAHHYSPATSGLPLTVGSLGWSLGAFWQARQRRLVPEGLVARGFLLIAVAVAGFGLVAAGWGVPGLVFVLWFLGGTGMGISIASTAVRVMALSAEGKQGFNAAALQIADMLGQTALIGVGGVVVTALSSARYPTAGVAPLDLLLAVVAVLGALLVRRCAPSAPEKTGLPW